jgi:hypothetical protein
VPHATIARLPWAVASREKILRCVYLDDAGFGTEKNEPIAVVAAVLVKADQQWKSIERDVNDIIQPLVPEQDRANFEFHARSYSRQVKRQSTGKKSYGHEVLHEFFRPIRQSIACQSYLGRSNARRLESNSTPATSPRHQTT